MLLKPVYEDIDLVKVNGPLPRAAEQGRRYATGLAQCNCLACMQHFSFAPYILLNTIFFLRADFAVLASVHTVERDIHV